MEGEETKKSSALFQTILLTVTILILLFSFNIKALDPLGYDIAYGDGENDVVEFLFTTDDFSVISCDDKPHLDIKMASTKYKIEHINFTLELYNDFLDDETVRYEFQGWFNDTPKMYFDKFNYVLAYSNNSANITFDNGTIINITNYTMFNHKSLSVYLPIDYFPNATTFDFLAQSAEFQPDTGKNYGDSTMPLEAMIEPPEPWWKTALIIISFVILGIAILSLWVKNKNLKRLKENHCSKCGTKFNDELEFCVSCGEDRK